MFCHACYGFGGVALAAAAQEVGVLIARAMRVIRRMVEHGDERAARHQVAHQLRQRGIARGFGQRDMEVSEQLFLHAASGGAGLQGGTLHSDVLLQQLVVDLARVGNEQAHHLSLQGAAHGEHFARLLHAGTADEGALVWDDLDEFVLGQHYQRRAYLGAADGVNAAQRFFAQPSTRRQAFFHDSGGKVLGNALSGGQALVRHCGGCWALGFGGSQVGGYG